MSLPSGSDDRSEPEWPRGDPSSLTWWLEEGGAELLGRDVNKWLAVIYYASSMIWTSSSEAERLAYRDAAITACDLGKQAAGLSDSIYAEKAIYTRMSFIRNSDVDGKWRSAEMALVLNAFLDWAPMDLESARERSATWRSQPLEVIKALRQIKSLLNMMAPGAKYLTEGMGQSFEMWSSLLPLLP